MNTTPTGPSVSTLPLRARKRRNQLNKRPKSGSDFETNYSVNDTVDGENNADNILQVPSSGKRGVNRKDSGRRTHSVIHEISEESRVQSPSRCRSAPTSRSQHKPLHRSLPKIPHTPHPGDYGIFGQDEDDDDEGEMKISARSQSQGNMLVSDPSPPPPLTSPPIIDPPSECSPSQRQINASVARSLSQRESSHAKTAIRDGSMTLPTKGASKSGVMIQAWPRDSPDTSTASMDVSVLNMTEPSADGNKVMKRRGWRKKSKRMAESMIEPDTATNRWKMSNFKSSLKSLFSRKRYAT